MSSVVSPHASGDTELLYDPQYTIHGKSHEGMYSRIQELKKIQEIQHKYSWPKLPDVSSFEIELGKVNPLTLSHGIVTRYASEIEIHKYRNHKLNRYLLRLQIVLLKHINSPSKY